MTAAVDGLGYALTGPPADEARRLGLDSAEWFQPEIDPAVLRELQQRTNGRAGVEVALWLALLVLAGAWAWSTVWSWWSIPAFLAYGALYGGAADARWHECGHGTAFRTAWLNDLVYHLASFMLLRGPTAWRWSHYRHHTDTIVRGRDPEIVFQRPASVPRSVFAFLHLQGGPGNFRQLVSHAFARIDDDVADFVPRREHRRMVWESRAFVAIVSAVAVWSIVAWTPLPILFVGGPTIYGAWLMVFFGITQHAGMRENVLDHRLNTRTVRMNPVFRFLYLNMNYHVEHHLFPSVPYRALPRLHDAIGDQLAPPRPNVLIAYREIFTTLTRQSRDPSYEIPVDLPDASGASRRRIDVGETSWVHGPDGWVDVGAAASLDPGELRRLDIDDATYVLCRLDRDSVVLADGLCTHARAHLADGALVGGQIECPKHNGRFDARTGEPTRRPPSEPICTYEVAEVDGRLVTRFTRTGAAV